MEFEVLGPLHAHHGNVTARLTAPMSRTLLGILLSRANVRVSVDALIDALWAGRPDPAASKNLQVHVHRLRRALGEPSRIRFEYSGYVLRVQPGELDAERFETLLVEGADAVESGEPGRGAEVIRKALGLWRGEPFGDAGDVPLLRAEAERLTERRLVGLEELHAAELACGRHFVVVPELAGLAREHPLRERLQELVMLALYRTGRQAEALEVYRRARRLLVDELGTEPGPGLARLHEAILAADPVLDLTPAPAATAPPPAQLPPDITDFTGRSDQLARLRDVRAPGSRSTPVISAIAGKAGVGKTTLAVHLAHQLRTEFPDGQLYVNLRGAGSGALDPAEVLARFLRALGVDGASMPPTVEERAALYRSRLADRRVLVLLDNATDEAQVRPLVPGAAGCAVLVTSRARLAGLDGARLVDLDTLDLDQAVDLLSGIAGAERVDAEPGTAEELVRLCGYLPLAVRIAAGRLAARPHWRLDRLAARLTDEHRLLDELRLGDLEVRASLALSHEGLDPAARQAFRRLALLEAPDFAAWVAAALLDAPPHDAERLVERLVDVQLLEVAEHDATGHVRYRFHDLVRAYGRERLHDEDSDAERGLALRRVLGAELALAEQANQRLQGRGHRMRRGRSPRWGLDPWVVEALLADPYTWFEADRVLLVTGIDQAVAAGLDELAWELTDVLTSFLQVRGYLDDWRHIHEQVLTVARCAGNRRGEAVALRGLGRLAIFADRYPDALRHLERALVAFEEVGDRQGEADVRWYFGETYRLLGRVEEAARCLEQARALYHDLDDPLDVAYAQERLALLRLRQGDLADAQDLLEEALGAFRSCGDQHGEASSLRWTGRLRRAQGRCDDATSLLAESLALFERIGDPHCHAHAMQNLAEVRAESGQRAEAGALFEQCLAVFRERADRFSEAEVLLNLGELRRAQSRPDDAGGCLRASLALWQELDLPWWQARTLRSLGEVHADAGSPASAREAWRTALDIARHLDEARAGELATELTALLAP